MKNTAQRNSAVTASGRRISNLDACRIIFLSLAPLLLLLLALIAFREFFDPFLSSFSANGDSPPPPAFSHPPSSLARPRMAICLVGGARRFELTGPSIVKNLLKEYPNADLFLHSPMDENAYKFFLLREAPRIAGVRIFEPGRIQETKSQLRVLSSRDSPNGIQGLLQYFNLVEGCLTLIAAHESLHNFTYEWIVRTRVDGYWSGPLDPSVFHPDSYVVPPGSRFGGLNDRFGAGDRTVSAAALSRLSLIPLLDAAGYRSLNSESAFKAQLNVSSIAATEAPLPFCVISDRRYDFPPSRFGVPVAAMGSRGPLNGAKCRPCVATCSRECAAEIAGKLEEGWSWIEWRDGGLELCNATGAWEEGWEVVFDRVAGEAAAAERRSVETADEGECEEELGKLRRRTESWDAPPAAEICRLGLNRSRSTPTMGSSSIEKLAKR